MTSIRINDVYVHLSGHPVARIGCLVVLSSDGASQVLTVFCSFRDRLRQVGAPQGHPKRIQRPVAGSPDSGTAAKPVTYRLVTFGESGFGQSGHTGANTYRELPETIPGDS